MGDLVPLGIRSNLRHLRLLRDNSLPLLLNKLEILDLLVPEVVQLHKDLLELLLQLLLNNFDARMAIRVDLPLHFYLVLFNPLLAFFLYEFVLPEQK